MRDAETARSAESLVQWFGPKDDASRPPRVPCRQPDGSYDLCYPMPSDKVRMQRACEAKVLVNCCAGARQACSIRALRESRREALLARVMLFFGMRPLEREGMGLGLQDTQERVMTACLAKAEERCQQHSEAFCAKFDGLC
jgi:hypothetical protein